LIKVVTSMVGTDQKKKEIQKSIEQKIRKFKQGYYIRGNVSYGFDKVDGYLVENKETGERNAMKHVVKSLYGGPKTAEREAQNYQFAMNNKAKMNQKFAKYLPDVYNVVETTKDYFIFMELLENIPDRVKADLFALNQDDIDLPRKQKYARLFKDTEAVYEILNTVFYTNLMLMQGDRRVHDQIRMNVPNAMIKRIAELSDEDLISDPSGALANLAVEESMKYLKQDPAYYDSLPEYLKQNLEDSFQDALEKQIVPVHGGHGRVSAAGKSGEKVERNFPEAQGLMRAMKYFLERENWQPKDVHSGNVMVRPGTKDFVITDLGLFSLR